MKSVERQQFLLTQANKYNFVSIPQSALELKVSVETIRRDINILCNQKKLKKVHGGAVPVHTAIRKDPAYNQRFSHNPKGREAVAAAAARLIKNGDVVTIDSGATNKLLAQHITGVENVTFVVNSLHIATILAEKLETEEISGKLIMIGGTVESPERRTADTYALESLDYFRFDLAFLTASAVSADSVSNATISATVFIGKQMRHAATTVLVADSEKLGSTSAFRFAMPRDFDYIFVDDQYPVPQDLLDVLEDSNTKLTIVRA